MEGEAALPAAAAGPYDAAAAGPERQPPVGPEALSQAIMAAIERWLTACGTPGEEAARQPLERGFEIMGPDLAQAVFGGLLRGMLASWLTDDEDRGVGRLLATLPALLSDSTQEGSLPPGSRALAGLELARALDETLERTWEEEPRSTYNELAGEVVASPAFELLLGMVAATLAEVEEAPPDDLPRLRLMLERSRLLSLVDQLLYFEQDGDREAEHAYQACMGCLSFPALARLVCARELCSQVQAQTVGQARTQSTLNDGLLSCLEWWTCYGPGKQQEALPPDICLDLLPRLTHLLAAHMPIASSVSHQCNIVSVMGAVLSKCREAAEPFFQSDACVIMAQATAACLRRARLAQCAQRQQTLAAGEHSAAAWVAARALLAMRSVMLCAEELPGDEEGVVHVPPAVLAAFACLRDATAGGWSEELQAAVPAFFAGIVAADPPLVELVVAMARDGVEAAAAGAASEAASGSSGGASGEEAAGSAAGGGEEGQGGAASSPSETGGAADSSRLVATCLLLRSMVRSAYILGRVQPAAAFLRRFAQLAREGSEAAWSAQLLLRPALLLLSNVLPNVPLEGRGPALRAISAAVQAAVALPPDPRGGRPAALAAALQAISAGAGNLVPGGSLIRHFLSAGCLPAAMLCLQHGNELLQRGGSGAASGRQLVDQALQTAILLAFPAFQRPTDGKPGSRRVGIVVVRQQVPSLLRQAALQLAAAVNPAALLQAAELAEGTQPAPGQPAAAPSQPPVVLAAMAVGVPVQQLVQQAQQAADDVEEEGEEGEGEEEEEGEGQEEEEEEEGEEEEGEGEEGEDQEEGPPGAVAALVEHALGQLAAMLFGLNLGGAGGHARGPPRNQLMEEALLLATAAALHSPAARSALLGQPGTLASLVVMLRRTCQHATQDQQASSCATLFGALAWHGGSTARQLVDSGAVHAVLHALHAALGRAQHAPLPIPVEPALASLRAACVGTLAVFVSQAGAAGTLLCQAIMADGDLLAAVRQAAERPPNASVCPKLSALLEVAEAMAGGMPQEAVLAQYAPALQQMGGLAPDSLYHVFGDASWPAQVVHMCAAQMGTGCLPFSGAGAVAGLEAAVKALGDVLLDQSAGTEDDLGIETDETTADQLRSTALLPPLLACQRWVVRETQQEPPHLPLASLLGAQYWLLALLHGLAARGPACAALVAQAGGAGAVEAVMGQVAHPEALEVEAACCTLAHRLRTFLAEAQQAR